MGLVQVVAWCEDGYVMELLSESGPYEVDIRTLLQQNVWVDPAEVKLDLAAHLKYVDELCSTFVPHLRKKILRWGLGLSWDDCVPVCTHGDPTRSNIMFRGAQPVLIDPIPARPEIPDLREVDEGKILQSAVGYETARFSWPDRDVDVSGFSDEAWYWCAVHFLRLLPYTPKMFRDKMIDLLGTVLWRS